MPDEEQTLHVRINRATDVVWEGEARSVTSKNAQGPFDVLPLHANFISLVRSEPIVVEDASGAKTSYDFKLAVMYVNDNKVQIFADIG